MLTSRTKNRKNDIRILVWIIVVFLFTAWLCTPPGNKFLQICFWGNNTKLFINKLVGNKDVDEYIFYRNNAVYIAKMFPKDKKKAINEINKAIYKFPPYGSESDLASLHKDKAYIELYYGDYTNSLNDFMRAGNLSVVDYLPVALLFKEIGDYRRAISYCNAILDLDMNAFAGYACLSYVYESAGRPDISVKIWDLALDKKQNNYKAYIERSKLKNKIGDIEGAKIDLETAKKYSSVIDTNYSIIYETLHPKILSLTIK